jgi:GcrA cell cycle regulator
LSSQTIARCMFRTKNSIVGRAHRLDLPRRASPIKPGTARRDGGPKVAALPQGARIELPRQGDGLPGRRGSAAMLGPTLVLLGAAPAEESVAAAAVVPATPRGVSRPCCFPIGEPRTKEFRYCDAPGVPGRPYCAGHMGVAYVARPERSEANIAADAARRAAAHARMARGGGTALAVGTDWFAPSWAR